MRGIEFLNSIGKIITVGEYSRLQRQAMGLRKLGLYPDQRQKGKNAHVTVTQAAHLIRLLALNADPFNTESLEEIILSHEKLKSDEGNYFILDLAEILIHGGILPNKQGVNAIQRISFSLDRNWAVMIFEDAPEWEGNPEEEINIIKSERIYGTGKARHFERFSIIKRNALLDLSTMLTETGNDMIDDDLQIREQILGHITSLK